MSSGARSAAAASRSSRSCAPQSGASSATISVSRSRPIRWSPSRASTRPSVKKHAEEPGGRGIVVWRCPVAMNPPTGGEESVMTGS